MRTALRAAKSSRIGVQIWVWRHKRRQTTRLISTSIGEGEKIALQVRCGKEPVRWPQAAWARRDKAFGLLRALNLHGQKALGGQNLCHTEYQAVGFAILIPIPDIVCARPSALYLSSFRP